MRQLTDADAVIIAKSVVSSYESVEQNADAFQREFNTSNEVRAAYVATMRKAISFELYEGCKKFLTAKEIS